MTGGGRDPAGSPLLDSGFLKDWPVAAGTLPAGTTRTVDSNGFVIYSVAAAGTGGPVFQFMIPRDYDEATDTFAFNIIAKSAGATDTPTITVTPKKIDGISGAATAITAQTTAATSATYQKFELDFKSNSLKRDSIVEFTITSSAHTTDALQIIVEPYIVYRSTLVSYHEFLPEISPDQGDPLR